MIDPNLLRNNLAETAQKLKIRRNFDLNVELLKTSSRYWRKWTAWVLN